MLAAVNEQDTPNRDRHPLWSRADTIALATVVVVAALLRFLWLGDPSEMVFDEVYYAKDACNYVTADAEACMGENNEVHPPVGKWLIAGGIKAFGFDSFGWRFAPAVAGVLTVAVLYVLARRLFGRWIWATAAAGLLAIDPLHFVQSRTSMLDIFLPLFGLAALLFLRLDADRLPGERPLLTGRSWQIAAGTMVGLLIATKWSGAFFAALIVVLALTWAIASRSGDRPAAARAALRAEGPAIVTWLMAWPVVIYLLSYIGQIHGKLLGFGEGTWAKAFINHHRYMWDFHTGLEQTHSYQSPPWSWILIKRPVSYFFCAGDSCTPAAPANDYQEIFATGSPLVWWASIAAIVGVAIVWARRRDHRRPEGLILAGVAFTYGPWLVPGADRPAVFIFYLLPTVPFMILALVYWMQRIAGEWEGKAAIALFLAGAAGLFFFYFPLLTKRSLPQPQWQSRIWEGVFDNCDKPPGESVTTTIQVTENGEVRETTSQTQDNTSLPPNGWCWI